MGLIPGWGTKIPHATWCSQKKLNIYVYIYIYIYIYICIYIISKELQMQKQIIKTVFFEWPSSLLCISFKKQTWGWWFNLIFPIHIVCASHKAHRYSIMYLTKSGDRIIPSTILSRICWRSFSWILNGNIASPGGGSRSGQYCVTMFFK